MPTIFLTPLLLNRGGHYKTEGPAMRRVICDQHEFDPPESEQNLELAIASPSHDYPNLTTLLTKCGASGTHGPPPPKDWRWWPNIAENIERFAVHERFDTIRVGDTLFPLVNPDAQSGVWATPSSGSTVTVSIFDASLGITGCLNRCRTAAGSLGIRIPSATVQPITFDNFSCDGVGLGWIPFIQKVKR